MTDVETIRLQCPICKNVVDAPMALSGQGMRCPACRGNVPVPSALTASVTTNSVKRITEKNRFSFLDTIGAFFQFTGVCCVLLGLLSMAISMAPFLEIEIQFRAITFIASLTCIMSGLWTAGSGVAFQAIAYIARRA